MTTTTNLNIRTDKEVKEAAEQIFNELGLSMTTAVNIFLRQTIRSNGIPFELKLVDAIQMLNAIELYASACYDNTQKHVAAINALTTAEEVEVYNYRTGYPAKLRF